MRSFPSPLGHPMVIVTASADPDYLHTSQGGNLTLPASSGNTVLDTESVFGIAGNSITPNYHATLTSEVQTGVTFGPNETLVGTFEGGTAPPSDPSSYKTLVQNTLVALGNAGYFYPVTYDKDTGYASIDTDNAVTPGTVLSNELTASFSRDKRNGRTLSQKKDDWTFELILEFSQEVTLDFFDEQLATTPPSIPRDENNGFEALKLLLVGRSVTHPPQQGSPKGTFVTYKFNAFNGRN